MNNIIVNMFWIVGNRVIESLRFSGFVILLLFENTYYLKDIIQRRKDIFRHMFQAAVKTLFVVSIVAMFTGMILTVHTGVGLKSYGLEDETGNIVIMTLSREMGPFTAAIILIASIGSAMAAEIGTMKVSEEIDALEVMSISPVSYLVMPRVVALTVTMPIATVYIIVMGVLGSSIVAKSHLNVSFFTFYEHVLIDLHFKPVYVGLLKSVVFGICISTISCAKGLWATNGAKGVGKATRDAVVASFLLILVVGYFITELFFKESL